MSDENSLDEDLELKAMREIFAALKSLDADAQRRVLDYVDGRLGLQRRSRTARQESDGGAADSAHDRQPHGQVIEDQAASDHDAQGDEGGALEGISPVARKWMRRNGLTETQMSELYSLGVDEIDLVAKNVPGSSARERLRNVMLLQGIASYLSSGAARIDNDKLRETSKHYDADAGGNFNTYLKGWASEISGSRTEANLTLTTRGLNSAKDLIKGMTGVPQEG